MLFKYLKFVLILSSLSERLILVPGLPLFESKNLPHVTLNFPELFSFLKKVEELAARLKNSK